jgi:hypothetical protein
MYVLTMVDVFKNQARVERRMIRQAMKQMKEHIVESGVSKTPGNIG